MLCTPGGFEVLPPALHGEIRVFLYLPTHETIVFMCQMWTVVFNSISTCIIVLLQEVVVVGQTFRYISSQAGLQLSECVFLVTLSLSSSTFYYETDHTKCEITLVG